MYEICQITNTSGLRLCESVQQEGVDQGEHSQLVRREASASFRTFPALTKSMEEGRTGGGRWRGDVGVRGVKGWGVVARGGGGEGRPAGPPSPPAPARCSSTLISLTRTI